jgi:hypothetical protein
MRVFNRRFWQALIAVLAGNAVYFAAEPHLPPRARHTPFAIDWGLAVDFWICLAIYGLLAFLPAFRERKVP